MPSVNTKELNNALLAISQSLADRSQLASTLDAILVAARQLTMAKHGIIYVLDQTKKSLMPTAVHNEGKTQVDHAWQPLSLNSLQDNDPFSYALKTGEVVLINDLYQYNGYNCNHIYDVELTTNQQSQNLLAWPLVNSQKQTVGLLVLLDMQVMDDEQSLTSFTQLAGASIHQAVLLEQYNATINLLSEDNKALLKENKQLKQRKTNDHSGPIAESDEMQQVLSRLQRILSLPVDVLLRGETGTGKEVVAKYIHENSTRASQPFIIQNCAAIPEQLLESELFGHKKGAFTGADKDKIGLFEAANGGTLFLDEIGDMPLLLQAKLLRILQERTLRPIGSTKEIHIDVRVIAATHCNLMEQIKQSRFRADLFYRLNVFPVTLPPLRDRTKDILPLAKHFIRLMSKQLNLEHAPVLSPSVRKQLIQYAYPGNVRELRNIVERAVLLSDFDIIEHIEINDELAPLSLDSDNVEHVEFDNINVDASTSLKEVVGNYEREVLLKYLNSYNWQTKRVADELGLPVSTLSHKMKKYDISAAC